MAVETLSGEGMPTHAGDLSVEGRGIEPVPASARYGSVGRIFSVWFTPNLVPAAFFPLARDLIRRCTLNQSEAGGIGA